MHVKGCGLCKGNYLFILLGLFLENINNVHLSLVSIITIIVICNIFWLIFVFFHWTPYWFKINNMLIFPGDHECGSSSQRTLSVQEAAAYLKVSSEIIILITIFLKFI